MDQNKQVGQFDMNALKKRVSESVQSTFGMLIPEAEFQGMVEKEVKAFFDLAAPWAIVEKKVDNPHVSWHERDRVERVELVAQLTPFRILVWEKCREVTREKLTAYFSSEALRSSVSEYWNGNQRVLTTELGALLDKKLSDMAPQIVAEMFRGFFANAAQAAKSEILSHLPKAS